MMNGQDGERGQTMTEYILVIALIAIFVIGAIKLFGKKTSEGFQNAADTIGQETGRSR
jgi:Flp pilus assembly pilin Flp